MREAAFVKQNKDKWVKFESVINNNTQVSPDELSELYIEVTDDLSYARTFFQGSNTLKYLNGLSGLAHQKIYKTKKESRRRLLTFFTEEFPREFYQHQKQLLIAFLIFVLFVVIGAYSSAVAPDFVRSVLGDSYVETTLENIDNNDPMAIYKDANQVDMFMGITLNNIKVALFAFALGILLGIGTIYIVMQNAIMLGSFQYFFYQKDLLWESASTIWIHGTLEISAIIVASCAGLVLAKGLLFPGTYSRLQSFVRSFKSGLKIVLSTVPIFIVAGALEGFVTRYTGMPDWLSILIIAVSLAFIIFYYVIYPFRLNKKTQLNYEH